MQNVGEEIVGEYLKWCRGCDFVAYNVYTPDTQGEIDVVGINSKKNQLYVCEVAIHLETGLQYVKEKRPDNVGRLTKKLSKDIDYARTHLANFSDLKVMLWSPIVRDSKEGSKNNQLRDVEDIKRDIAARCGLEIEAIVNQRYLECLDELRGKAIEATEECKSTIMRFLQIDGKLRRHLERSGRRPARDETD